MPLTRRGELAVDVEAVVREQHDQLRAVLARLLDVELEIVLANAERPVRDHPARIGDRRIGQRLADDGDLDAAALDHRHGSNAGSFHSVSRTFCARNGNASCLDQLLDPLGAERELPVPDHGVRLEQRHAVDHVLALADERRVAVLPGVAAVEERDAVAALGADRLEDGGDAVEPAEPAVALGQRGEIDRGQGIGRGRARRDLVEIEKRLTADMRHQPLRVADAEIGRRLAEQERHELGMNVGDVHERDVADRVEPQQFVLRQALLRQRARPPAGQDRRGRGGHLKKIAPRKHYRLPDQRTPTAHADQRRSHLAGGANGLRHDARARRAASTPRPRSGRGDAASGHGDRFFADDLRPVVVDPGQHDRAGFLRPELELDVRDWRRSPARSRRRTLPCRSPCR